MVERFRQLRQDDVHIITRYARPADCHFVRTAKAAGVDRLSRWDLIAAIADDATDMGLPISSVQSCLGARTAMLAAGCEYADDTIRKLSIVAKFDHESSDDQRSIWRRYGWTSVRLLASAGWTQDAAADFLGGEHRVQGEIRAEVKARGCASPEPEPLSVDEMWAQWVNQAHKLLSDGSRIVETMDDTPGLVLSGHSSLGLVIYQRMSERQLDAELRNLLEDA